MVDEEDTATEVAVLEKYKAHSTIQSGSLDGLLQFLHEKIAEFRKIRDQEREAAAKKLTPLLEAMVVWIEFDPMDEEGLLAKAQETLRTQMPEVECKPADRPAAESEGAEQTV